MLGYPECRTDLVYPSSVLYRKQDFGMGYKRSFDEYMKMVGIDVVSKTISNNDWCLKDQWPSQAEPYRIRKLN